MLKTYCVSHLLPRSSGLKYFGPLRGWYIIVDHVAEKCAYIWSRETVRQNGLGPTIPL